MEYDVKGAMSVKEEYRESDSDTPIYRFTEIFNALREGINTYERYGVLFERLVLPKIREIYDGLTDDIELKNKTLLYSVLSLFRRPLVDEVENVEAEEVEEAAARGLQHLKFLAEVEAAAAGGGGRRRRIRVE